jgi:RND superfamily putative drug exporter
LRRLPRRGTLPGSRTERRAYDLVAGGFGPGANSPLLVVVDTAGDVNVIDPLVAAVAADRGIAGVAPPVVDAETGVATVLASAATSPQDEATLASIERLRSEVFPTVLVGSPASAHVGGARPPGAISASGWIDSRCSSRRGLLSFLCCRRVRSVLCR